MFESSWLAFSGYFPHHCPDSVCSGRGSKLVDIISPAFRLGFLYIFFLVFAQRSLKAFRLFVVGSLLNSRKAALCRRIAVLQSSLNQGVLCLFEAKFFLLFHLLLR